MKKWAILLMLLLAPVGWGATKVLRTYDWNGHRYSVVQREDGSRVEIKGDLTMTTEQAIAKTPARVAETPAAAVEPGAMTDDQIRNVIAEAKRRGLLKEGVGNLGEVRP